MNSKKLTLLGMSGVGKTHLAKILSRDEKWFHYSGDYRIGSHYLNDNILSDVRQKMMQDEYLATLLLDNSIKITNNISIDNLSSVSHFLGKVGNPNIGGLPLGEFNYRQNLHLDAEKNAMLDVGKFIKKSAKLGINNFINDAGGSLCEIDDAKIYQYLADETTIIYIRPSEKTKQTLIERAKTKPKPLYYNPDFFKKQVKKYLKKHNFSYAAQINPDAFVRDIFPNLVEYRVPKYQAIADKYGITINADDMYLCKTSADFFDLVGVE